MERSHVPLFSRSVCRGLMSMRAFYYSYVEIARSSCSDTKVSRSLSLPNGGFICSANIYFFGKRKCLHCRLARDT